MKILNMLALSIFLLTLACQNDNIQQNCEGDDAQTLESYYSQEFASVPCGLQNIDETEKEINLVITNEADFEKYFGCHEQLPEIDFNKYVLLAGRYTHHQCAMFGSQQVFICSDRLAYRVRLLEQDCLAITSVFYATVIEKQYNQQPIVFDVQFNN